MGKKLLCFCQRFRTKVAFNVWGYVGYPFVGTRNFTKQDNISIFASVRDYQYCFSFVQFGEGMLSSNKQKSCFSKQICFWAWLSVRTVKLHFESNFKGYKLTVRDFKNAKYCE